LPGEIEPLKPTNGFATDKLLIFSEILNDSPSTVNKPGCIKFCGESYQIKNFISPFFKSVVNFFTGASMLEVGIMAGLDTEDLKLSPTQFKHSTEITLGFENIIVRNENDSNLPALTVTSAKGRLLTISLNESPCFKGGEKLNPTGTT
jgi:hypothetical protein